MRLDAAVRERCQVSWGEARQRISRGKIFVGDAVCTDIGRMVERVEDVRYVAEARRSKPEDLLLPKEAFRWVDRDIVVVEKPAELLTVPYDAEDRVTLNKLVQAVLAKREKASGGGKRGARPTVLTVHRLDKGTSGLLVFARNGDAMRGLKEQFRAHSAEREYIALAHGAVKPGRYESHQVANRGDGIRGSLERAPFRLKTKLGSGKRAVTHVEVLETYAHATLIVCRLETGRTNQIRIHLSEAGYPLVGEDTYMRGFHGTAIAAPRLCLHARTLGFVHPKTGEKMRFESDIPNEIKRVVKSLGPPKPKEGPRLRLSKGGHRGRLSTKGRVHKVKKGPIQGPK